MATLGCLGDFNAPRGCVGVWIQGSCFFVSALASISKEPEFDRGVLPA